MEIIKKKCSFWVQGSGLLAEQGAGSLCFMLCWYRSLTCVPPRRHQWSYCWIWKEQRVLGFPDLALPGHCCSHSLLLTEMWSANYPTLPLLFFSPQNRARRASC